MVATKDIVAGDSRVWNLNRQRLLAMGEAPQNPKIEALLRTSEGSLVNLTAVDANGLVIVTLAADVSETLPMGTTYLIVRLTADEFYRRTMVLETFRVLKKVADADFDHRTEAERCLAQAEKALMDYTTNGRSKYKSYTIGSRTLSFGSAQELMDLAQSGVSGEVRCLRC